MDVPNATTGVIEMIIEAQDVQCTNCSLDLRPENALMIEGNPFCDRFCYQHYKMDELVQQLADIELAISVKEASMNRATAGTDQRIADLEHDLDVLKEHRTGVAAPFVIGIVEDKRRIDEIKAQIVETWDGKKKTLQGDGWVLKFKTTKSVKINDKGYLLSEIMRRFNARIIADEFISGFNKTKVKKFMDLYPQSPDSAELIEKTTVKLEQEV